MCNLSTLRGSQSAANSLSSRAAWPGRGGKDDVIFFKTGDNRDVGPLSWLGGIQTEFGAEVHSERKDVDPKEISFVDKSPVYLTEDNIDLLVEPSSHDETIPAQISREEVLKTELPPASPKWDGGWHGTEGSRMKYLRENHKLWAFCSPDRVMRKTSVFAVRKKDGNLRKILACCNFNDCCRDPGACLLPGSWNISKIRFRNKRFHTAESDVSNYYSRLEAPDWLKFFLALDEVRIGEVVNFGDAEFYECPYTKQKFSKNDIVCPCWPRIPMGWSWSVAIAVRIAERVMNSALQGENAASLNIHKNQFLRSADTYYGGYIDNLFTVGESAADVDRVQDKITDAFKKEGFLMSEESRAAEYRRLLGLEVGGGHLRGPAEFFGQCLKMSRMKRVQYWMFQKLMGRAAWIFPLKRRFFSILYYCYRFLAKKERKNTSKYSYVTLSRKEREELKAVAGLSQWLGTELKMEPAAQLFACDASLNGWGIVQHQAGGHIIDNGLETNLFEQRLLTDDKWRRRKSRPFKRRLSHVLPGEICAFRQCVTISCREHRGKDIMIYTDNSNIYHAIRKGRSNSPKLNSLARHVLLSEIVYGTRLHVRWCGTKFMPADKYTREMLGK